MRPYSLFFVVAFVVVQVPNVRAEIRLPAVIGSHMVVQREQPVRVWGWATPGESVAVRFADTTSNAKTDQAGRWQVTLPKFAASSRPRSLYIKGSGLNRVARLWIEREH